MPDGDVVQSLQFSESSSPPPLPMDIDYDISHSLLQHVFSATAAPIYTVRACDPFPRVGTRDPVTIGTLIK